MQIEKVTYRGWQSCYRMKNDLVDLVLTADVGPRVIRFGFSGRENEFKEFEAEVGRTGGRAMAQLRWSSALACSGGYASQLRPG